MKYVRSRQHLPGGPSGRIVLVLKVPELAVEKRGATGSSVRSREEFSESIRMELPGCIGWDPRMGPDWNWPNF